MQTTAWLPKSDAISQVDYLVDQAIKKNVSDIHIEPFEQEYRIRYRQDGVLYAIATVTTAVGVRLIARLKIIANLDIAERRLPQDGHFQLHGKDMRVNTCPLLFGEKIVLRLLNPSALSLDMTSIGLSPPQLQLFLTALNKPQGFILVTGPTGSGKTMTLYSALRYLNTSEKNISTIEDPIEMQLANMNQLMVNPKIGLDFAAALRSFLRQDPDVLMVGEIRDRETAIMALQAAQTGHLVLSTLHTNNAIETLARLQLMNIASYHLANSLSLIVAQRLVRILCLHCRKQERDGFYQAIGCDHCLQGYQGRTAVYECLPVDDSINELLLGGSKEIMKQKLQHINFISLQQAALDKAKQGITSLAEIKRVIMP